MGISESLKDTAARTLPYFESRILPDIKNGKDILVAAHGNSLRSIVMQLDNLTREQVIELNIPTGQPLVYELDESLKPIRHYYLGDEDAIKAAMQAVANQGKAGA